MKTIVPDCLCMSDVIRAVGLQPRGQNEKTIKRWIKKLNIDTSHFDISAAKARGSIKNNIFVENSSAANSVVKRKVLRGNLIPYECSKCGLKDGWQGMPLNLQLDHKNGINNDHRLENLRFLCPNCHSQTPTWGHTVPT